MVTRMMRRVFRAGSALVLLSAAMGASADVVLPFTPTITMGGTQLVNDEVRANADGSFTLIGEQQGGGTPGAEVWGLQWNLTVSQDPFIVGSIVLTNLASTTKNFNFSFLLPVAPAFSPSQFGGSVTATLLDLNNSLSATLAPIAVSPSIYRGQIDGATVLSLFGANLSCSGSVGGCSTNGGDSDGLPGPTLPGPGVASNIGMLLNFSLTAGDRVTFASNFTVEPPATVPLPAALPMLVLGLGTLAVRRRRPGKDRAAATMMSGC